MFGELFNQNGRLRRVPAGDILFFEGDRADAVFLVESGLLRIERTTASGRVVLLDLAGPGDVIGELGVVRRMPRSASVWAIHDSTLLELQASKFAAELEGDARIAVRVLTETADRLAEITHQLVEASAFSAAARVAAGLLRLAEKLGVSLAGPEPVELKLPVSQQRLAEWAGMSREGFVAGLGDLRSAGVIATARMRITILDCERLREIAARG